MYIQMLNYAAGIKCWQLSTGNQQLVKLTEGIFVEGDLRNYGDSAAAFVKQFLPIFAVPWALKLALEQAGTHACKTLTPAVLR